MNNKLPICIDAFLTDESRHQIFNRNMSLMADAGWDVFVFTNRIHGFTGFSKVKYLEYDNTNRILADRSAYELPSPMYHHRILSDSSGNSYKLYIHEKMHGFTNWTLFYNMRREAETVKRFGYTHYIHTEYDIRYTNTDLMGTLFREFGDTPESLRCMVGHNMWGFGAFTNTYLMNVDLVLDTIPLMNTEEEYREFLIKLYGSPQSPVYERMFEYLFLKDGAYHVLTEENLCSVIDFNSMVGSAGDVGNARRSYVAYGGALICPIHDGTACLILNENTHPILVEYTTGDPEKTHHFSVGPGQWITMPASHHIKVVTVDMMASGLSLTFDLVAGWDGYGSLNPIT